MAALQYNLSLTLDANRNGFSTKIIDDVLALTAVDAAQSTQQTIALASGVSNQAVSLGAITTATVLLLISDQVLTVKLNGEATGHACANMLLTGAAITAMTLSNASGIAATVRVYLLG